MTTTQRPELPKMDRRRRRLQAASMAHTRNLARTLANHRSARERCLLDPADPCGTCVACTRS